jgi:hypothetical protein
MERRTNSERNSEGHDETDRAESYHRSVIRRTVRQYFHDSSPGLSGIEILESPGRDDSAYHTFPHTSSSTHSFSKSSSVASSDRFPSEESLRSSSPVSSKKVHTTLIRIQLGDDKKVSHEWYHDFTSQSHHNQAFSSPLANRAANSSSHFEYDSHIAHMRGKTSCIFSLYILH